MTPAHLTAAKSGSHLLGKKSWNVYNQDNIERVRRDEAEAQARALEEERVGQDAESDQRLAILRGGDSEVGRSSPREENGEIHRKRRRLAEDHKTDKDSPVSRPSGEAPSDSAPLFDHTGHIDLVSGYARPAEGSKTSRRAEQKAESEGVRLADAAGYGLKPQTPWYSSMLVDGSYRQDGVSKDVWGNEDPRRRDREKQRMDANDPLAAMKRGVRQLRTAEADRKDWKAQRERDLNEVEELAKQERKHSRHRRRRDGDEGSLDGFDLDNGYRKEEREGKSGGGRRRHHHHRHDRRRKGSRDRRRSRSPRG